MEKRVKIEIKITLEDVQDLIRSKIVELNPELSPDCDIEAIHKGAYIEISSYFLCQNKTSGE